MRRYNSLLQPSHLCPQYLSRSQSLNIGIGIGSADYDLDFSSLGGGSVQDSGTGTKFYGGYSFNKYFAAEAAYYTIAEASIGAVETSPGSGAFVSAAASMKGFGAYAVGIYPVSKKFNLMAKLGMLI